MSEPILEVRELTKHFPVQGGLLQREVARVHAVDRVSFSVARGETLGLVGESGCGKSTLARLLVRLIEPDSGAVQLEGRDFLALDPPALKAARARIQLDLPGPVRVAQPAHVDRAHPGGAVQAARRRRDAPSAARRCSRCSSSVGLREDAADRFPHEFSGGQRQRIGIARAIALEPQLVICDEPVSALDVSIQSQVLNLLRELQQRLALTYVFISHDLAVVRYIADRVAVMYLGRLVEIADTDDLYAQPRHPYTHALLAVAAAARPAPARARRRRSRATCRARATRRRAATSTRAASTRRSAAARERPQLLPLAGKPSQRVACHLVHSGELPPFAARRTPLMNARALSIVASLLLL